MTTQTDISRNPKDWDGKNSPQFTKQTLISWIAGVALGCFIGMFTTIAVIKIIDPPCIAGKTCSEHGIAIFRGK